MARRPRLTLLIDADILTYQEASAGQRAYAWDGAEGEKVVGLDDFDTVKERAEAQIVELVKKHGADAVILCYTDSAGNFRKKVLPSYKATRGEKPVHYYPLREHLSATYPTYLKPGLEGDDVMGILATHPKLVPGEKIIVSIDKDLLQVPGRVYNPRKGTLRKIDADTADWWFFMQVLTGDPTDEYKGCPGVGPIKAERILDETKLSLEGQTRWGAVVEAYEARGLTEQDALVQARVARILRHTDYDFKRKEPILWTSPT